MKNSNFQGRLAVFSPLNTFSADGGQNLSELHLSLSKWMETFRLLHRESSLQLFVYADARCFWTVHLFISSCSFCVSGFFFLIPLQHKSATFLHKRDPTQKFWIDPDTMREKRSGFVPSACGRLSQVIICTSVRRSVTRDVCVFYVPAGLTCLTLVSIICAQKRSLKPGFPNNVSQSIYL